MAELKTLAGPSTPMAGRPLSEYIERGIAIVTLVSAAAGMLAGIPVWLEYAESIGLADHQAALTAILVSMLLVPLARSLGPIARGEVE